MQTGACPPLLKSKFIFPGIFFLITISVFSGTLFAAGIETPDLMGLAKGLLNPKIARESFDKLIKMGNGAVPVIREMLKGKNLRLIRAALDITEKIGSSTDDVREGLSGILSDRRFGGLRIRAARLMGKLGEPWDNAVPALFSSLKDSNNRLRIAAAESLMDLASRKARFFPDLITKLSDPANPVRKMAVEGLSRYGQTISPIIPLAIVLARKGPIKPSDVLSSVLPVYFPGLNKLTPIAKEAMHFAGSLEPSIGPNSTAIELQDAEAEEEGDAADAALSFEDIPAGE